MENARAFSDMKTVRPNPRFQLRFADRIGIVFDITRCVTLKGLNIVSMEVQNRGGTADVYLELQEEELLLDRGEIITLFSTFKDIRSVSEISTLPQEKREKQFKVLFDGVSDGIISTDENGRILTVNRVAIEVMNRPGHMLLGKDLSEISGHDSVVYECMRHKAAVSRWETFVSDRGRVEYFASGQPITNEEGQIIGAVLIMKDHKEVREIVRAASTPACITFDDFICGSPVMRNLIAFSKKIAATDTAVSIRGKSGTGKELIARAIHFESGRTGPFVPVNCAAMPESLLESELFGYAEGAFTGARKKGKPGLFEAACGGTIFLDEIGDMPAGPQAKILRVLQEGSIRRIGGTKEVPVNARVITATNRNLEQMVEEKSFREDLYYRINVFPVHIPPLKERHQDIPLLVSHFLKRLNLKLGKREQSVSSCATEKLLNHSWPGNVREVKNVIERAAILCDFDEIEPDSIMFSHESCAPLNMSANLFKERQGDMKLKNLMDEYEKTLISKALGRSDSIRKTAASLGISHTALMNKMKKHDVGVER